MESFARVFSSSTASKFPNDLRAQLMSSDPLVLEESLYASYVKREPGQYVHNPSRASIAITRGHRLVVIAAGHKQIDILLSKPEQRQDIQIWTEKNGNRIHFKIDLQYYKAAMGGASIEIRVETKSAEYMRKIIEEGTNIPAKSAAG